jgi:putative ABC transport system permease protein
VDGLIADLRYAVRTLLKSPGYALAAVITLALGIGADAGVFSVLDGVLLRPLPYAHAERLFMLTEQNQHGDRRAVSYPTFQDWKGAETPALDIAYLRGAPLVVRGSEGPERVLAGFVSPAFFSVMGSKPLLGRLFERDEEAAGAHVAVITYELWRRRFGGRATALDSSLATPSGMYAVIGVLPKGFQYPSWAEVYAPIAARLASDSALHQRGVHVDSRVVGRLRSGTTVARASAEMAVVAGRLAARYPTESAGWTSVSFIPLRTEVLGMGSNIQRTLLVLAAAVALVLLLACANVANLTLVRAGRRARELGVRAALGAPRRRIVRQMLTESAALALLGAAAGLLLADWGIGLLRASPPQGLPRPSEIAMDGRVFAFTAGVAVLATLLAGLLPALRASAPDLNLALKEGSRGAGVGPRRSRLRSTLVAGQVAVALTLLVGAALLIGSFWRLTRTDPGFDPSHVVTLEVFPPAPRYAGADQALELYRRLADAVGRIPGVRSVALSNFVPLGGGFMPSRIAVPGRVVPPNEEEDVLFRTVSAPYFRTMGIPVVRGRGFTGADDAGAAPVAIVNETLARNDWPNASPVGHSITLHKSAQGRPDYGQPFTAQIVGVVGDVHHVGLEREPVPEVYIPYTVNAWGHMALVVKTGPAPEVLVHELRRAVLGVDQDLVVSGGGGQGFRTMNQMLARYLSTRRFSATLLSAFALCALILAAVGMYGVVAHGVGERAHELGVRIALGAAPGRLLRSVIWAELRPAVAGSAVGIAAAAAGSRFLARLLYEVPALNPPLYAGVAAALLSVTIVACWLPARRATKVDPVEALKTE